MTLVTTATGRKGGPHTVAVSGTDPETHGVARPIGTYREFWPHYLREHARPLTRHLHFLGTALAVSTAAYAVATLTWWLVLAAAATGYLFAWIGHLLVERNRPATFSYPVWSLASDFRMFFLWLVGRLAGELRKAGVAP